MAELQESNLSFVINDLIARIRILEGKYNLFGERLLVVNQNMIKEYKNMMREIKAVDDELKVLKHDMQHIKEVLASITKELDNFARKDSLKVLEKYINLLNPLNLVTEKEVRDLVRKELGRNG